MSKKAPANTMSVTIVRVQTKGGKALMIFPNGGNGLSGLVLNVRHIGRSMMLRGLLNGMPSRLQQDGQWGPCRLKPGNRN